MKKAILLLIILSLLTPGLTKAEDSPSEEQILTSILNAIGGEYIEGDFSANGLLVNKFLEEKELTNLSEKIITSLGLVGKEACDGTSIIEDDYYIKEVIFEDGYKQINYLGFDSYKNPLTIIVSSYINEAQTKGETYLYVNLIKREHFFEINDIIYKIENIFKELNQPVEFTTCIIGSFEGKFDEKIATNKIIKGLHKINGKVVDEYKDFSLISYTAYTDLIDKSIFSGDNKVNLNVALRYSEYDDKTLIWVGTPIIANGY